MSLAITTVFFTETVREMKKSPERKTPSLEIAERTQSLMVTLKKSLNPFNQNASYKALKVDPSKDNFTYYPPSHFTPADDLSYPASLDEGRVQLITLLKQLQSR